jgi:trans-2-enoyl-CoA reductase
MASSLHYKQLDESFSEFRLLTIILSPDETAPVSCVLETYSLADSPPFHALSYVWGNPKLTADIYVNGSTFKATQNLVHALRAMRLRLKDPKDPITS